MVSQDDMKDLFINPVTTTSIADYFFKEHEPQLTKVDWVNSNSLLIHDKGAEFWLNGLLNTFTAPLVESQTNSVSPYGTITISQSLKDLAPYVDKKDWLAANVKLIGEIGGSDWLMRLLNILETGTIVTLEHDEG